MKRQERLRYNAHYLNLNERQVEIHDIIMQSMMNTWPKSLIQYIQAESEKYGISADPLAYWVADWIAGRDKEEDDGG